MKRNRWILCDGAILGFSGVLAGALLDHAAARFVVQQHAADTALRYHQLHAIVITALGLVLAFVPLDPMDHNRLVLSARLILIGTVVFCGSLYALAFNGAALLGYGAPIGGITMMAGWLSIIWTVLRHRSTD